MPWQECSKVDERLRFVARLALSSECASSIGSRIATHWFNRRCVSVHSSSTYSVYAGGIGTPASADLSIIACIGVVGPAPRAAELLLRGVSLRDASDSRDFVNGDALVRVRWRTARRCK
jgi:hypothetical protein